MPFYIGKERFEPVKKFIVGETYVIHSSSYGEEPVKKGQFVGKKHGDAIFTNVSLANNTETTYSRRHTFSLYDWEFYRLA